jgi:hypothetical protein
MSHLFLSHLSKENNCPNLVHELFTRHADGTKIVVASRFEETAVYKIVGEMVEASRTVVPLAAGQLRLSFA